ncbi:B12-binding domain-containing radical SAM protein [candidate division WOR-3 bacterium]|nr:B12-binding domain-containing radical SAM protein [candidate division WOR-3 bacterium]
MKVLLVRPINRYVSVIIPNLGLGYLATQIRKKGHEVKILDCVKEKMNFLDFERFIDAHKPDIIGIQMFTCDFRFVRGTLNSIKRVDPEITIILGGPHPSAMPRGTILDFKETDFLFQGEAEIGLPKLLQYIEGNTDRLDDIPGLVFRDNKKIRMNPQKFIQNLDTLDFPSWDLMVPSSYPPAPHGTFTKRVPTAPIITTRGCPYRCKYCAAHIVSGRLLRKRSVDNVISEIELLVNRYGVKEIHIEDDNFTLEQNRVKEFCHKLIEKNLHIIMACPNGVRLDTLNKELIVLMEEAGFYSFAVGIESATSHILREMNRNISVSEMENKVQLVASMSNIKMTAYCILGFPCETREETQRTINFTLKMPFEKAQFSPFMPLPGTDIFKTLSERGEISANLLDWDKYLEFDVVYAPSGMSIKELRKIIKQAFAKFYFRIKIIVQLLRELKSFHHFTIAFKRVMQVFK